jgi:hypothetical protein
MCFNLTIKFNNNFLLLFNGFVGKVDLTVSFIKYFEVVFALQFMFLKLAGSGGIGECTDLMLGLESFYFGRELSGKLLEGEFDGEELVLLLL